MAETLVLVIDDEAAIREMVRMVLESADFSVQEAQDSEEAWQRLSKDIPDLILMDWMLPRVDGLSLVKRLRKTQVYQEIPIIILTAKGEEDDRIKGLDIGADDYVVKPFSPKELIARINAVLRRSKTGQNEIITIKDLHIDLASQRVNINNMEINLTPNEYRLLVFFATHADRVYTREQLLNRVWGQEAYIDERSVDVQIRRLRKALAAGGHAELIQTVRGSGYRFSEQL